MISASVWICEWVLLINMTADVTGAVIKIGFILILRFLCNSATLSSDAGQMTGSSSQQLHSALYDNHQFIYNCSFYKWYLFYTGIKWKKMRTRQKYLLLEMKEIKRYLLYKKGHSVQKLHLEPCVVLDFSSVLTL